MRKNTLVLIALLFSCSYLLAQKRMSSNQIQISQGQERVLQDYLAEYEVVELDIAKLKDEISISAETRLILSLAEGKEYDMIIYPKEFRSSSFTSSIISDNEEIPIEIAETVTYEGYLSNGNSVRLTVDNDFIYGGIQTDGGMLIIKQLKYLLNDKTTPLNQLVLYKSNKVLEKEGYCATPDNFGKSEEVESVVSNSTSAGCKIVEVALDCDTEYWNLYNDNSFNMMLGEVNLFQEVYEDELDAVLSVTTARVIIGSAYTSTDGSTIINEIKNLWSSSSYSSIPRDLVHHFTGKDTGPFGQASTIGGSCTESNPVCWTEDRTNAHQTVAHEIGHLLNGRHEDGTNCGVPNVRSIMCQGDNKQLTFSAASRTRITNFVNSKSCFNFNTASITGVSGMCVNNTKTYSLTNFEATAGTTIAWSTNGRLSILSGQGTKSVVVKGTSNGNGVLTVVINYPGSCGSVTETKNILVGPPLMSISIYGPDASGYITATANGGTSPYTWTLNNNTTWTTTSATTNRYVGCNGGYLYVQSSNACGVGSGSAFIQPCSGGYYYSIVYPNPTSNEFYVVKNAEHEEFNDSSPYFKTNVSLSIYDFSGKLLRTENYSEDRNDIIFNVSDLKKGSYFLIINADGIQDVHQVIVK